MRGVVVSGIGTCGSYGFGVDALRAALSSGRVEATVLDRSQGFHRLASARTCYAVDGQALAERLPRGAARRLSPTSRLAVAAAHMAVEDAGLTPAETASERTSVALGVALGTSFATRLLDQIYDDGPLSAAPILFIDSVSNAPAGQVAVALGARGPNLTVTQHQASGLLALIAGVHHIQSGRCDRAVVGAADEMSAVAHAALDRFGALARPANAPDGLEATRPFGQRRSGFVAAEGSTLFVLEAEELAIARGARCYARVVGGVRGNDPTASSTAWGQDDAGLAATLMRGLERLDVPPASIDVIVSGASGSRTGDALEASVLRRIWPEGSLPTLLAPKSTFGEYGGGFLGAAALALDPAASIAPPPAPIDPTLGVTPFAGGPLEPANRALVTTLAAGGAAAWVVLERV